MLRTFLKHNIPFRTADSKAFRKLLRMLKSSVEIPTADILRRELQVHAKEAKEEIKKDLEGVKKISIALDAWSSPNHKAFLAIQAYYITDDYKYRYILIGF